MTPRVIRFVLFAVAMLIVPVWLLSQSTVIIRRDATGVPGFQPGVTLPFDTHNAINCYKTNGDNFECITTGGPLRGDLVEDFAGDPIAPGQNFSTPVCGAAIECEPDSDPEKLVFNVTDTVGDATAEELYDDLGLFSITHPPHVYEFIINDYDIDTSAARLIHRAAKGNTTLEAVDAAGQAEAAEPADWDCPQVAFVCWHTMDSSGNSDADGPPSAGGLPGIYVYVNGGDGGTKLADVTSGSAKGCDRTIPTYGWQEDDLIALKIDCTGCSTDVLQDFYVRVGCH